MAKRAIQTRLQKFGKISIVKLEAEMTGLPKGARWPKLEYCRWQPLKSLREFVFKDFELGMGAVSDRATGRSFMPRPNPSAFILLAALGGDAIRQRSQRQEAEDRDLYRATRLIFQFAPQLREYYRRDFTREQDLILSKAEGGGSVLPPDLGLKALENGHPWGVAELLRHGRDQAEALGRRGKALTPATFIRLGLLEAAKRNPVEIRGLKIGEASNIVRLALFDLGPSDSPTDSQIAIVTERLLGAIENHIEDDTDTFNKWFRGELNNIVHQIAKKRQPEAPMDRELVRKALLEIVFRSFHYVGDCVDRQMQDFARAFPCRYALTELESLRFDAFYRKQPWLGNLPLVLLHERFAFLREFLRELDADPSNSDHPGVLLRLLAYYGAMASRRREVDAEYKRRGSHRNAHGRRAAVEAFKEDLAAATGPNVDKFPDLAALLRNKYHIVCESCRDDAIWESFVARDAGDEQVVLRHSCTRCNGEVMQTVDKQEIRIVGQRLMTEE